MGSEEAARRTIDYPPVREYGLPSHECPHSAAANGLALVRAERMLVEEIPPPDNRLIR